MSARKESERSITHSLCPASGSVFECRCEDVWHHHNDGGMWNDTSCKATEKVTYVSVDALREMLELAYHPQGGDNPAHPNDVIERWLDALNEERHDA